MLPRDVGGVATTPHRSTRLDLAGELRRWGGRRTAGRIVEESV